MRKREVRMKERERKKERERGRGGVIVKKRRVYKIRTAAGQLENGYRKSRFVIRLKLRGVDIISIVEKE